MFAAFTPAWVGPKQYGVSLCNIHCRIGSEAIHWNMTLSQFFYQMIFDFESLGSDLLIDICHTDSLLELELASNW